MVFEFPKNRSILYVKRLVALPGDTIEVFNDSRVFVNDKEVKGVEVTGEIREELRALYDEKGRDLKMRFEKIKNGR
jgi:signal peptidase I